MQQIKLTTDPNTIHVDNVDVSKGVYYHFYGNLWYIIGRPGHLKTQIAGNFSEYYFYEVSLKELVSNLKRSENIDCYTLSGQRITLEKELTIADLKDSDHVGFVTQGGDKGFVQFIGADQYAAIDMNNGFFWSKRYSTIEVIESSFEYKPEFGIAELYIFATRTGSETSLFRWLNSPGK